MSNSPLLAKFGGLFQKRKSHHQKFRIERQTIMEVVFEFAAKSEISGPYLEFGVYQGDSLIRAYQANEIWLKKAEAQGWSYSCDRFYAIDSFQGLPVLDGRDQMDSYGVFQEGQYSVDEEKVLARLKNANVDLDKVTTIKGFYSESLKDRSIAKDIGKASVIHIDCDLYSSAVDVLNFCSSVVQDGTILVYDDYYCYRGNPKYGVRRAFEEWLANSDFGATQYYQYSWAGQSFILNMD